MKFSKIAIALFYFWMAGLCLGMFIILNLWSHYEGYSIKQVGGIILILLIHVGCVFAFIDLRDQIKKNNKTNNIFRFDSMKRKNGP